MKTLIKIITLMFITSSAYAFEANQHIESVKKEIQTKVGINVPIETIYSSAVAVGIDPKAIVEMLIAVTGNKALVLEKLISAGVDVSAILTATASGNVSSFSNSSPIQPGETSSFSKFANSPTSTFSGGGFNSASRN